MPGDPDLLPKDSPVAPEWEASVIRLSFAIALSLAIHAAIIFGLRFSSAEKTQADSYVIQARLETTAPPSPSSHPQLSSSSNKQPTPAPREMPKREEITKPVAKTPQENNTVQDIEKMPPAPIKPEDLIVKEPEKPAQSVQPKLDGNIQAFSLPQTEDQTYYTAKEVDVHPVALTPIHLDYPEKAQENNIEGSVIVVMLIDENGVVRDISIVKADPPGYFEKTVVDAFKNALFRPAIRHGQAVKSRVRYNIHFGS